MSTFLPLIICHEIGIYETEAELIKICVKQKRNRNLQCGNGIYETDLLLLSLEAKIFKMKSVHRAFEEYAI